MAAGIRQRNRRTWPRGLEEPRPGYYVWAPPADVRGLVPNLPASGRISIGRVTLDVAIAQVIEAYMSLAGRITERRLVHAIHDAPDTLDDWCLQYLDQIASRDITAETIATSRRRLRPVREALGHLQVQAVTTRHVSTYLATIASTPRTQQATRSLLNDLFREAMAAGWCATNPVEPTRAPRVATQRGRLSLEAFKAIHAWSLTNQPAWATRAMELAIVTAQRRGDIAAMTFGAVKDGRLLVAQQKSGGSTKVSIPLSLRLNEIGWTVGDVIGRCRDAAVSRYLVHHSSAVGRAKSGDKIRDMTLGQAFAEARDAAAVSVAGKTPPTFHEIRSLSLRLYDEQGVNTQALAGHKSADMTSVYRDVRGDEWIMVEAK
ncbi:MAG: phage integrase family protein [Candidatus Accumulibacter regalis]|jgi:integrase|uniref:tyrosine-type recombinase/integrase n=1 Tax=Candidatus Accumulibacter sp. ACC005 TaxID=2823331 RepID=UPI0025BC0EFF|nr:tyrosine-type recombinase/integrase [Candidatus Accumulibacter sp. ACC005]